MSKFRKTIVIFGMIALCIAAALITVLALSFSGALVTEPIRLVYQVVDNAKVYDGEPLKPQECVLMSGELVQGHRAVIEYYGSQTEVGESESTVSVRIRDENDYDVTDEYAVRVVNGRLTVSKSTVYIRLNATEVVYSGNEVTFTDYSVTQGSLAAGHRVGAAVVGVSVVEVGDVLSSNMLLPAIYDFNGRNVSSNYDLYFSMGTVRVVPRPIAIRPVGGEKTYDGRALVCNKYEITSGSLVAGHYIQAVYTNENGGAAQITDVGETEISLGVTVCDASGRDVTANYAISGSETATLKITPRDLVLTAKSASWEYDGAEHTLADGEERDEEPYARAGLVDGQTVTVSYKGAITEVGEAANEIDDYTISGGNGNYSVTCIPGKLTVTKARLTVRLNPLEKVYDGAPFQAEDENDYYTFEPALREGLIFRSDAETVLAGITQATNTTYQITEYSVSNGDTDCTENFLVTVTAGRLSIQPKEVRVRLQTTRFEKQYDGLAFAFPASSFDVYSEDEDGNVISGIAAGESVASVGCTPIVGVTEGSRCEITSLKIVNGDGDDVSRNYRLAGEAFATVTVKKAVMTVGVRDDSFEYGTKITSAMLQALVSCDAPLLPEDFVVSSEKEFGDAGSYRLEIAKRDETDEQWDNYELTLRSGTLTILPKHISVTVQAADGKTFDGISLTDADLRYRYDGAQLPAGAAVRVVSSTLAGKLHAGVYEADAAFEVVDSDGAVNGNYAVRSVAGTYTILPQKAELRWSDAAKALMTQNGAAFEKTYDGAAFNVRSEWLELYSAAGYRFDAFAIASVQCDSLIRVKTETQTDEFGYFVEVVVQQPLNLRNPRAALKDGTEVYTSDLEITLSSEVSGQTVLVKKRALSCVIQSITVSKTITEEEFESLYPDLDSLAQLSAATPLAPTDTSASVLFSVDYDLTDNVLEAYKAGGAKILNSLGEDVTDCYSFSYAEGMIFRV